MCQTQDTKNQYYDSPINATIYEIQKMLGTNRHPISLEEGFLKGKKKYWTIIPTNYLLLSCYLAFPPKQPNVLR